MRIECREIIQLVDSQTVLGMLNKTSQRFSPYMGRRVGEIQAASKVGENGQLIEWAWIEGKLNIADWITRGKEPDQLAGSGEWVNGPEFLSQPVNTWPISRCSPRDLPKEAEERVSVMMTSVAGKTGAPRQNANGVPTRDELEKARVYWIRQCQLDIKDELEASVQPGSGGRYRRLGPVLDQWGMWVVGERVKHHVEFTSSKELPPILPSRHRFSVLAMEEAHGAGHGGVTTTLAKFRRRYWITQGGKLAKNVRGRCVVCRKTDKRHVQQVMGPLPEGLLKPAPVWAHMGLDLFGPFRIRGTVNKRTTGKAYGVLFVCLLSKAVHLELIDGYSTSSFLMGLRRFAAVRGWPQVIYSDGGTQLTSAAAEIEQVWEKLDAVELEEIGGKNGFSWRFGPGDSPWRQGTAERLIGWVKRTITLAVGDTRLNFSELLTVFYEAMQLVNQRPVGVKPRDDGEHEFLCPNDLLLGRASAQTPPGPYSVQGAAQDRLRLVQRTVDSFWSRWAKEVAPNLLVRRKWHHAQRDVKVGDLVLVADANAVRGSYHMAVVSGVTKGSDGRVRTCAVAYKNFPASEKLDAYGGAKYTAVRRAVQRLVVVLPVDEQGGTDWAGESLRLSRIGVTATEAWVADLRTNIRGVRKKLAEVKRAAEERRGQVEEAQRGIEVGALVISVKGKLQRELQAFRANAGNLDNQLNTETSVT
ncbi:PREDICTED: uncharacterized protein LOC106816843 [Priapulus caudatus]|uniref:Uncharacterized protein LOC106816843 n=1 Tax=Priapulus caudatus TaxID=37621 RepID=A0ABM1EXP3_PRICU|nr:PREDICTED: uncharacterized protein LOC106816843 [Priapulus caudatus]